MNQVAGQAEQIEINQQSGPVYSPVAALTLLKQVIKS